jgi:hypothetical protein
VFILKLFTIKSTEREVVKLVTTFLKVRCHDSKIVYKELILQFKLFRLQNFFNLTTTKTGNSFKHFRNEKKRESEISVVLIENK